MQTTLKIFSIIDIVLGALAMLGSLEGGSDAVYAFLGGALFLTTGIIALNYISQVNKIK
jgi:hypothetical protein